MTEQSGRGIGNLIAPPRFLIFAAATAISAAVAIPHFGQRTGTMIAFDVGAALFVLIALPLLRHRAGDMRRAAERNDANRLLLLFLTLAVSLVVLVAVASELMQRDAQDTGSIALIVGTLALCWVFSNTIYALHYAHLFYRHDDSDGRVRARGFEAGPPLGRAQRLDLRQPVDEHPVAARRRNAAGGGMRAADITQLFQVGHDVADGRR